MREVTILTLTVAAALCSVGARGDDEAVAVQQEREARLKFMQQIAESCVLSRAEDPAAPFRQSAQPVIRYSNPVRNFMSDGATFFWLDGERPVAAVTISIRGSGNVFQEFTSLSTVAMTCQREDAVVWSPVRAGLMHQTFSDTTRVAASTSLRLTQMRRLAGRFSAEYTDPRTGESHMLRLLSQPLYRYSDEERGILDGAVFGLAEANDPECLLIIEALTGDGDEQTSSWRYSLARMSSAPMTVGLEGTEIWSVKGYWRNPKSIDDPYREAADGTYPRTSDQ